MNASLSTVLAPFNKFIGKYHTTIFFTFITLLLAGAILTLYLATQESDDQTATSSATVISSTFDNDTAAKVQQLHQSDESSSALVFPKPRSNPFVE